MWCRQSYHAILLVVLIAQGLSDQQLPYMCDDQEQCASYEYLSISDSDIDCENVCDPVYESGSGSEVSEPECQACDSLCTSCYGPANDQCYSCESYYVMVEQGDETFGSLICGNGVVRNTSLDVMMCVSECSKYDDNDLMECSCPEGRYVSSNGSCLKCSSFCGTCVNGTESGCLRCSNVSYNGQCMEECPSGMVNVNRICEQLESNSLFPIDRITLFSIIGAAGFLILFCVAWICCIIYCCFYREKRRRKKNYLLTTESPTSISESFKKVARNISIKRRPPRPISTVNPLRSEQEYARNQIVSQTYDPYHQMNSTENQSSTEVKQESAVQFELTSTETKTPTDDEDVYMAMTPATSIENLANESQVPNKQHQKLSFTKSYDPPSNAAHTNISKRTSLPYTGEYFDDEDLYANEDDLAGDRSQENYVVMDLHGNNVAEDYIVPSDLIIGNSQTFQQQEECEQELYMDMETQPPIPRKGVVPARQNKNVRDTNRKDTLDNEYVRITGIDQKLRNHLSDEQLAPKYVNVQRSGDPRLRSVTSPVYTKNEPVKKIEIEEQPIYQNFDEDNGESFYGNID